MTTIPSGKIDNSREYGLLASPALAWHFASGQISESPTRWHLLLRESVATIRYEQIRAKSHFDAHLVCVGRASCGR